jgi:hypothetical protein
VQGLPLSGNGTKFISRAGWSLSGRTNKLFLLLRKNLIISGLLVVIQEIEVSIARRNCASGGADVM